MNASAFEVRPVLAVITVDRVYDDNSGAHCAPTFIAAKGTEKAAILGDCFFNCEPGTRQVYRATACVTCGSLGWSLLTTDDAAFWLWFQGA